jgi:hypothetical protein
MGIAGDEGKCSRQSSASSEIAHRSFVVMCVSHTGLRWYLHTTRRTWKTLSTVASESSGVVSGRLLAHTAGTVDSGSEKRNSAASWLCLPASHHLAFLFWKISNSGLPRVTSLSMLRLCMPETVSKPMGCSNSA